MKKFALVSMLLASMSSYASTQCWLNNLDGKHIDLSVNSQPVDSGEPFGIVRIEKVKSGLALVSIINGEETVIEFKKKVSITKQGLTGGARANFVCL